MDQKKLFSIIIPTYNCADKLRQALDSIKRQTFKDFEVIVCDDGSTDRTQKTIEEYTKTLDIKYLWEENWGGPARPRNIGINNAVGKYIAFLDADDWWYPSKLEITYNNLNNADIVYHDLDIFIGNQRKLFRKVKGRQLKTPVFIDLMINENALITSSVVIKKNIIEKAGLITEDKSLISVEDFDLYLKIAKITEKFVYIPLSLGAYRIGKQNISGAKEKQIERIISVYKKHLIHLTEKNAKQAENIMFYLLGRTKQKIGKIEEALLLFKKSIRASNSRIKIRSLFWCIFLSILIFKNKVNQSLLINTLNSKKNS